MPRRCVVPGCQSNSNDYPESKHVSTFSFPADEILKAKWIKAIHRKDWSPSIYSAVCEVHFRPENFKTTSLRPKLHKNAIPSIFPNQPSYMTVEPPTIRQEPSKRLEKHTAHIENLSNKFLTEDIIKSFDDFKENFKNRVSLDKWSIFQTDSKIVFYIINEDELLGCEFSVRVLVFSNLKLKVFIKNDEVSSTDLNWILPRNSLLTLWSQLINILARYSNNQEFTCDNPFVFLKKASEYILQARNCQYDFENPGVFDILSEQVCLMKPHPKKYNSATLIMSFLIYSHSAATYEILRKFLILPHKRHLQKISSGLHLSPNYKKPTNDETYISEIVANLKNDNDKIVNLLIDEIYISKQIEYKSNNLVGMAKNNPSEAARTVMAFMIKSAFGHLKEIVRLVPLINPTGFELHSLTLEVIESVQKIGLRVLNIITDNNRINQNLFDILSSNKSNYFKNPKFQDEKIFLQFDTVHLFKNFRNNWLNAPEKSFVYPDFSTYEINRASFENLRTIYYEESNSLIKKAFKLNYKSISPNSLERQNVQLVDNVFHVSTISALRDYGDGSFVKTAEFCELIRNWWDTMNTRNKFVGIFGRNEWSKPFYSVEDSRLQFLEKFISWLKVWKSTATDNNNKGVLSKDSFDAVILSTRTIIDIIKYALTTLKVEYVLTSKFQTDDLEGRFRLYRFLSGCSYRVSYSEVIASEKKIRVHNFLSHCNKEVKFSTQNTSENSLSESVDISQFTEVLNSDYLINVEINESSKIYASGYAAHAVAKQLHCIHCQSFILKSKGAKCSDNYFDYLQRGGLSIAHETLNFLLVHMTAILYKILNTDYLKHRFFTASNQKSILSSLTLESISDENFAIDLDKRCQCNRPILDLYVKICYIFSNMLLNNLRKMLNDKENVKDINLRNLLKFH